MKRALLSLFLIVAVGVGGGVGYTTAFFSDTEVSPNNQLTAGSLDLKIDSTAHYAGLVCQQDANNNYVWQEEASGSAERPELIGQTCTGSWELTDLDETRQFFNFEDLKPGDNGENTISIHVDNNDAWLAIGLFNTVDEDNGCTEPEVQDGDPECINGSDGNGELDDEISIAGWLDWGSLPGFQGSDVDPEEGDNIWQTGEPPLPGALNAQNPSYYLADALGQIFADPAYCNSDPNACPGMYSDGRIEGGTTYYLALQWCYGAFDTATNTCDGSNVNNVSQSDRLMSDIVFQAEQHRNNPNPTGFAIPSPTATPTPSTTP